VVVTSSSRSAGRDTDGRLQGMGSPTRRRGTPRDSRGLVTPAGDTAVADEAREKAKHPRGRSHIASPPRPRPADWEVAYPALDGLGQAALNAEADRLIEAASRMIRADLQAVREAVAKGMPDDWLAAWWHAHRDSIESRLVTIDTAGGDTSELRAALGLLAMVSDPR
jgi:hypothetical protein